MPRAALLGRKIGMTRLFDEQGRQFPVTVVSVADNHVSQVKTLENDGYEAVQIAFEKVKPGRSSFPRIGHDAKAGLAPKRFHREQRLPEGAAAAFKAGQALGAEVFEEGAYVDVVGTSKGKGFAGVMKRHHFRGQEASHGVERKHRSAGSVGGRAANLGTGKPKKGIRMAGHMGAQRVTVRSLKVVGVDPKRQLLLIRGPVPGPNRSLVMVREAVRLYKNKASGAQGAKAAAGA